MEHEFWKYISIKLYTFEFNIKELERGVREKEEDVDHSSEV